MTPTHTLCFKVTATHADPDDYEASSERVGVRATMAGAQALAAKTLGRTIHGFKKVGEAYGHPILETWQEAGERRVRIERGFWSAK